MSIFKLNRPWYKSSSFFLPIGILVMLSLFGCTNNPGNIPTQNTPVQNTVVQNVSVPNEGVYYFPVQKSLPTIGLSIYFEGKLVVKNGFIRAEKLPWYSAAENRLVIWPPGYSLDTSHHTIQILDEKGQLKAQVGDYVRMNPGGDDFEVRNLITGQALPAEFIQDEKPSWAASSIELYPYRLVYSADRLEANQFNSTIEGTLVLDRGYLRINSTSGKSYLPIWPGSSSIEKYWGQFKLERQDVMNKFYVEGNNSIVFVGDKVIVSGAEVSAESLKEYIWYSLPKDSEGPFLVVTEINLPN